MIYKLLFPILFVTLLFSCNEENQQQSEQKRYSSSDDFLTKTIEFAIANKDNQLIELPSLYDSLATKIPEKSILLTEEILIHKGFEKINAGRGNFTFGPRIVSKTYQKDDCICEISKLYYTIENGDYFQMTERISCMTKNEYEQE